MPASSARGPPASAVARASRSREGGSMASPTTSDRNPDDPKEDSSQLQRPQGATVAQAADGAGVSEWLDNAGKAIGLIAGVVGGAYAVGGLVVTLRVVYHGFSLDDAVSVVGQLPREYVVTTGFVPLGIAPVLRVTLWLIAIRPAGDQRPDARRRVPAALPSDRQDWLVFAVDASISLVFAGA